MTKHADRIWRTVVFAGAMLGAPLVSADTPSKTPKPVDSKQDSKQKDTVEGLTKELQATDKLIAKSIEAITGAQNEADRKAAKAKLESQRQAKADLETRLARLKNGGLKPAPPPPTTPLGKLEKELADNQVKIATAVDAVADAQNEADRTAAKLKLTALQKDKTAIEKKIAAEKQRLARPRTIETERPTGRGFVLS